MLYFLICLKSSNPYDLVLEWPGGISQYFNALTASPTSLQKVLWSLCAAVVFEVGEQTKNLGSTIMTLNNLWEYLLFGSWEQSGENSRHLHSFGST